MLLALAGVLLGGDAWAQTEEERTIPPRPGVTLPFLVGQPAQRPVASAILFAGGDGRLNLRRREASGWGQNFVVRNRSHGYLGLDAAVVEAIAADQGNAEMTTPTRARQAPVL